MINDWKLEPAPSPADPGRHLLHIGCDRDGFALVQKKLAKIFDGFAVANPPYSYVVTLKGLSPRDAMQVSMLMGALAKPAAPHMPHASHAQHAPHEAGQQHRPPQNPVPPQQGYLPPTPKINIPTASTSYEGFMPPPEESAKPEDFFNELQNTLLGLDKRNAASMPAQEDETPSSRAYSAAESGTFKPEETGDLMADLEKQFLQIVHDKAGTEEPDERPAPKKESRPKQASMTFSTDAQADPQPEPEQQQQCYDATPETEAPKVEKVYSSDLGLKAVRAYTRRLASGMSPLAPLNPLFTIKTLVIGSFNRTAHAKSTLVVETPGEFYNPFLIIGAPSSGKTHLVTAIARGIGEKNGWQKVLFTNGLRLSRWAREQAMAGGSDRISAYIRQFQHILIDDIHLMAVDDANRAALSGILEYFNTQGRQSVYSSAFNSDALAQFEAAWKINLPKGVDVEIRPASKEAAAAIVENLAQQYDFTFTSEEMGPITTADKPLEYANTAFTRLACLRRFVHPDKFPMLPAERVALVTGAGETVEDISAKLATGGDITPPKYNSWGRWGVFYPKGGENAVRFALSALQSRAQELGIEGGWQQVFAQSYHNPNVSFFPAQMALFGCDKKVRAIMVLGDGGQQEKLFFQACHQAFAAAGMRCGCIPQKALGSPSALACLLADLLI